MTKVKGEHSHTECPLCGAISDRTIYPFLDIVEEPELYDRMMIGDLFEYKCPACKQTRLLPHSCVYKDSEQGFYIYFVDEDVALQIAASSARMAADPALADDMPEMRWADTPGAFAEKAMLMTSEYDDRVIEIMKLLFEREVQENATVKYVGSCIVDLPADGFRIVLFTDNGNYYNTVIAEQVYDDIEKQIIDTPYYEGKGLLLIDRDWAIMAVDGMGDEPGLNGELISVAQVLEEEARRAEEEAAAKQAEEVRHAEEAAQKPEEEASAAKEKPAAGEGTPAPSPAEKTTEDGSVVVSSGSDGGQQPAATDPAPEKNAPRAPSPDRPERKMPSAGEIPRPARPPRQDEAIPVREPARAHVSKRDKAAGRPASSPSASPSGIASADDVFAMDANPFSAPTPDKDEKKMVTDSFGFEHEAIEEESPEEFVRRMQNDEDEDEEKMMLEMMGMGEDDE